jgi:hypothetical protein
MQEPCNNADGRDLHNMNACPGIETIGNAIERVYTQGVRWLLQWQQVAKVSWLVMVGCCFV